MEVETLERPASLKIWHPGAVCFFPKHPEQFDSLREAIAAAAVALTHPDRQPWIVTAEGDLLPPNWISGNLKRATLAGPALREAGDASSVEVAGDHSVVPGRRRAIRLGPE